MSFFFSFMWQSIEQIGNRADRLRIESNIYLYSSNDIEVLAFSYIIISCTWIWMIDMSLLSRSLLYLNVILSFNFFWCQDILKKVQSLSPRALVIDSVQTVYLKGIMGSPGGIMQVGRNLSSLISLLTYIIIVMIIAKWSL